MHGKYCLAGKLSSDKLWLEERNPDSNLWLKAKTIMNIRNHLSKLLALVLAGLAVGKASANGFRLADQDAAATARGEAFVATALEVRDKFKKAQTNTLAIETLAFVKTWLIDHIQKSDMAYTPYVQGKRAA